jgi:hypothetical protein
MARNKTSNNELAYVKARIDRRLSAPVVSWAKHHNMTLTEAYTQLVSAGLRFIPGPPVEGETTPTLKPVLTKPAQAKKLQLGEMESIIEVLPAVRAVQPPVRIETKPEPEPVPFSPGLEAALSLLVEELQTMRTAKVSKVG